MARTTKHKNAESGSEVAHQEKNGPLTLVYMSPAELAEHPQNWRRHPPSQIAALTDIISEVGWAGACLLNSQTGRLLDGHARKKVALEQGTPLIPVLVGSWDEATEKKILATLDPIASMAEADRESLDALLHEVQTGSEAIASLLDSLAQDAGIVPLEEELPPEPAGQEKIPEQYQVLVECKDESEQAALLEELNQRGYKVRSLLS